MDGGARVIAVFVRRYGASPAHLVGHLVLFAIAAYALVQLVGVRAPVNLFVWLIAAVLLHDFVLLPFYSVLDRAAQRARGPVPLVNHVRVPAVLSGLLLLVYFPPILGLNGTTFHAAAGRNPAGYARDWLLLTAAAVLVSALVYAVRVVRARR